MPKLHSPDQGKISAWASQGCATPDEWSGTSIQTVLNLVSSNGKISHSAKSLDE